MRQGTLSGAGGLGILCALGLVVWALATSGSALGSALAQTTSTTSIRVDGDDSDWANRTPLFVDATGDSEPGALDFTAGYAFVNDAALYLLIKVADPSASLKQFSIHIQADNRLFQITWRPGVTEGHMLDEGAGFGDLGPTEHSEFSFGQYFEARVDLRDIGSPHQVWISYVAAMVGTCCASPQWRAADRWEPGMALVPIVQETDPEKDSQYATGSVPVIEQVFDITAVRGQAPTCMVLSPDGRLAYVVCVVTDSIFVIDVATSQIVQAASLWPAAEWELGPGANGIAITPDGRKLVVAATNDESVLIVDAASLAVTRRIPVDGQPCGVAVSPDGAQIYVATSAPGTFMAFADLTSGTVAKRIPSTAGIGEAYALVLSPDGREIFVAAATALGIVNASTGRVVGSVAYPAGWIQKIAVAPDGRRVYISDLTNGKVHAIDVPQRRLASSFDVQLAEGLAVSGDGSRLYVTTFGFQGNASYVVAVLDAQSGEVLAGAEYEHPAPYGRVISDINTPTLSLDGRTLFLPSVDADGVLIVDANTLAARGMILLNALAEFQPWRSVLSPDGRFLYVASKLHVPTTVDVIDARTSEAVGVIVADPTSGHRKSSGLDVSADGKTLWVLSGDDRCLLAADTTARRFVDSVTIREAEYLTQVVVDPTGALAYVLDMAGSVYVVDLPGRRVAATIPTGVEQAMTMKLWPDRHRLYMAGSLSYAVVDTMSRRVVHTSAFEAAGEFVTTTRGIAFLPRQSAYVISDHFGVHLYDAATDKEMRYLKLIQLAGPIKPLTADITVSPDEQRAYFALWDEDAVLVLNPTTWQVVAKVDTGRMPFSGGTPRWLALDANRARLYVVCEEGDRVVVIDTTTLGITGVVRLDE